MKRFLMPLGIIVLVVFSAPVFSHAGPHENKNCFVDFAPLSNDTLRFSGYQFQGIHPDQVYCRIFPYLGSVIIKIEPVNDGLNTKKVSLQLLKLDSPACSIFRSCKAFSTVKKTALQSFNNGVVMIQTDIQQRGIYALNIDLYSADNSMASQSYLFSAGIPVTKILTLFSILILLLIVLVFIGSKFKNYQTDKILQDSENP